MLDEEKPDVLHITTPRNRIFHLRGRLSRQDVIYSSKSPSHFTTAMLKLSSSPVVDAGRKLAVNYCGQGSRLLALELRLYENRVLGKPVHVRKLLLVMTWEANSGWRWQREPRTLGSIGFPASYSRMLWIMC